ncbi:UNVERIFIED_CONTAM: hypothetical protein K2H54_062212 [Gekko kuhli]
MIFLTLLLLWYLVNLRRYGKALNTDGLQQGDTCSEKHYYYYYYYYYRRLLQKNQNLTSREAKARLPKFYP